MKLWTMPANYAGEVWPNWYVFLGQHRDSDCLTRSNFRTALERLGGESDTVQVIRESHWAVGWVEWIGIEASDDLAVKLASEMEDDLERYPVLSEDDFSELENEEANEVWRNCYDSSERIKYVREHSNQFEFHDFADLMGCIRGNYFAGYASELIN
jgi:hypothetical protein